MYIPSRLYVKVFICRGHLITPSVRHWGQPFLFLWLLLTHLISHTAAFRISSFGSWKLKYEMTHFFFIVKSRNGTLLEQNIVWVESCTPVWSRLYVSFHGPVRDEGCLIGLDICLTHTCNQVLCHAWPVTVRSYNAHFSCSFYQM
jgi:hypothetical protein